MKLSNVYLLAISLALFACGGSEKSNDQQITTVGETTIAESTISKVSGGEIKLPTGERLEIPAGSLKEDTVVRLKKEGDTFKFEPAGLTTNNALIFKIPVNASIREKAKGKHVVGYLYSDQSLNVITNSGKINADRLVMMNGDSLSNLGEINVPIKHFSIFKLSFQDRIYIPFNLPPKYLQKGDIVFALSHENYQFCLSCPDFYDITPESQFSFDWFPGHAAIIASNNDDLVCSESPEKNDCNLIESTPPKVRVSNLGRDFISPSGHLFMGAHRPKDFDITLDESDRIFNWANNQVGKAWAFLNDKAAFTAGDYTSFSCVGLVEASYKQGAGKGIINDSWRWLQDDGYVRPLDMYDRTKPVDSISVKAGDVVSFKVNAVFLSQDEKQYFDIKSREKASAEFEFLATGLPNGATFDSSTGIFYWDVPSDYQTGSVKLTFSVRNSWPQGILTPSSTETKYEYLTINVENTALKPLKCSSSDYICDNFDNKLSAGSQYNVTYGKSALGTGLLFGRAIDGRVEYPLDLGFPKSGTIEMLVKVDSAYVYDAYQNPIFRESTCAPLFMTDWADVTWPGGLHFWGCSDGRLVLEIATSKYGATPWQRLEVPNSGFVFGKLVRVGFGYGTYGQTISVNGKSIGAAPGNTQILGSGGNHSYPSNVATIGEFSSKFFSSNRFEGGYDGIMDWLRVSSKQNDWMK